MPGVGFRSLLHPDHRIRKALSLCLQNPHGMQHFGYLRLSLE
jgi:hypothetical protein